MQSWEQRFNQQLFQADFSGCGTVCFSRGHAVCLLVERVNPWMALVTGEPRKKKTALLFIEILVVS